MKNLPFSKAGRFWKGNLHTHSTMSDGVRPPTDVAKFYRLRGYDFLAITDHFMPNYNFPMTDTTSLRTEGFTTLIGAELHATLKPGGKGRTSLGDIFHILAVGLPLDFAHTTQTETGAQLARRAANAGAYVAIAHPHWYDLTIEDCLSLDAAHAIEIHNGVAWASSGKADSTVHWDLVTNAGRRLHAVACDDAHFHPELRDTQRNWVMVRSKKLDPNALLASLHAGHFYSTQGPEIHSVTWDRKKKVFRITTSPVRSVRLTTRGAGSSSRELKTNATEWEVGPGWLAGATTPIRLTITDSKGLRAWSNLFDL